MDKVTFEEYIEELKKMKDFRGAVRVVGRTSYRTASVRNKFTEGSREKFRFMENDLDTKDNHVVLIFQVIYAGTRMWPEGTYFALLTDQKCIIGYNAEFESF